LISVEKADAFSPKRPHTLDCLDRVCVAVKDEDEVGPPLTGLREFS
jgi:hypothetical protein